jgi:streptomycin 3"-adenylyltransferase
MALSHVPLSVQTQIDRCVAEICLILGNECALVVHGSIALNDFHLGQSDIDILGFVDTPLTAAQLRGVMQVLVTYSLQPAPIEFSLLDRRVLTAWVHPAPFLVHYSESWRAAMTAALADPQHDWLTVHHDPDLSVHLAVAHAHGIVVAGALTIPAPTVADAWAAVWYDIKDAAEQVDENPTYVILNLCRTLWWRQTGQVVSKSAGGVLVLPQLAGDAAQVVTQVLAVRRGEMVQLPAAAVLHGVVAELLGRIAGS